MKIDKIPGEFAFKALWEVHPHNWRVSTNYFHSLEEAQKGIGLEDKTKIKWPVEINEDGSIYIPDQSELE